MNKKKIIATIDGNEACAYSSYAFSQVAAIYPITPSSAMAEHIDAWSCKGKKNIFDMPVKVVEMQSEAGAAGTLHGSLQAGCLGTTYTASQGLLLMIPNLYKMVGELLPAVLHVSARSIATRALSIFGDHQDVYAVRQTGATMIASASVQEAADLAIVAHLTAIKASVPVIHFFDGFRTSHEIQKIELQDYDVLNEMVDKKALESFRNKALNPHLNPSTRGGAENDDIYFQAREAQNLHFENVIEIANDYFKKVSNLTNRAYAPFSYYGNKDAEQIIIAMGSVCETIKEVVDELNKDNKKVGLINVHLYRPFSSKYLLDVLPKTVKNIAVLDRTKEIGSSGEPLYLDIVGTINQAALNINIVGGRYGLSSKDTQPNHIKAVFDNLNLVKPKNNFTIGINDDVTNLSLAIDNSFNINDDSFACLFYGMGSDGTVSANKNSIKIVGENTNKFVQAYFAYDSQKSGGLTRSHLRFKNSVIRSPYYVKNADFISCSMDSYLIKYDMLNHLKVGGTFLLNTQMNKEDLISNLPSRIKKQLAIKKAKFYIINATGIAKNIGMGRRTNTILQSAFFKLNPSLLNYKEAKIKMKEMAKNSYSKKGEEIVKLNYLAIDEGENLICVKVDPNWSKLNINNNYKLTGDEYYDTFVQPMNHLEGNNLPVSTFTKYNLLEGTLKNSIAIKEKRNIAEEVPVWHKENCIQCNKCVFVCPHATIRAFIMDEDEVNNAPDVVKNNLIDLMSGITPSGLKYKIQVDPKNCVGCGLCVQECPGKKGVKALTMENVKDQLYEDEASNYMYNKVTYKTDYFPMKTVKGIGFAKPYFEVSGACAGCGEAPYYRLLTQLFGQDLMIANATGCSSIYSACTPSTPFVVDKEGKGVAWANSLFEDNAEYGYGFKIAENYKRFQIETIIKNNINEVEENLKEILNIYLDAYNNRDKEKEIKINLIQLIKESKNEEIKKLLKFKDDLITKSVWVVGGDGWAYDIGFGGLDHVLASNENINILVLDTEVYSNTGGQASKASQTGAIAKFAASGKKTAKKDLAAMAMTYGNVYVAQINMGANNVQTIKALKEAESFDGPSLVIAYCPCIEHGIKGGLVNHQLTQKLATQCGYFNIFRYDPRLTQPLQIDFSEPDFERYEKFLLNETRFSRLPFINPDNANQLMQSSKQNAIKRFNYLKQLEKHTS